MVMIQENSLTNKIQPSIPRALEWPVRKKSSSTNCSAASTKSITYQSTTQDYQSQESRETSAFSSCRVKSLWGTRKGTRWGNSESPNTVTSYPQCQLWTWERALTSTQTTPSSNLLITSPTLFTSQKTWGSQWHCPSIRKYFHQRSMLSLSSSRITIRWSIISSINKTSRRGTDSWFL